MIIIIIIILFVVQHVASIVFQEKIKSQEKLARKLSLLSAKQRLSSREVFFVLTDRDIVVKEANTTVSTVCN